MGSALLEVGGREEAKMDWWDEHPGLVVNEIPASPGARNATKTIVLRRSHPPSSTVNPIEIDAPFSHLFDHH